MKCLFLAMYGKRKKTKQTNESLIDDKPKLSHIKEQEGGTPPFICWLIVRIRTQCLKVGVVPYFLTAYNGCLNTSEVSYR
jgi:hypothetical protein